MSPRRPASARGFTLIELLVVIAIIAVLMGLLFPVVGSVQERAKKTQATSDCAQIVTAVKSFYAEYGKYPVRDDSQGWDCVVGNPGNQFFSSGKLMNTLRAISDDRADSRGGYWNRGDQLNPKKVVYFEGKAIRDKSKTVNGFYTENDAKQGNYYDPFGNEYMVFLDSNYDGVLDLFDIYTDMGRVTNNDAPRLGVVALSIGKDKAIGKAGDSKFKGSDDVGTW